MFELRDISKDYRGALAVRNVTFDVRPGEVHALLGENGAGKSTLTKMMAGVVKPTSGDVLIDGRPVQFNSPIEALNAGIAMVFQETSLVPSLTVAQNIFLGSEKTFNRLRGLYIAAQQFLQGMGFPVDPTLNVGQLGAAQKQMVEIARAVHHRARLIIFDEPTATLTPEEKRHFFNLVRRLTAEGIAIVFISHALEEALSISQRITIMRDGQHVITDETGKFDRDSIIRAMVGRGLSEEIYRRRDEAGVRPARRKVLSVQNLSMGRLVRNTSFSVYSGQVTGIFGLIGSGRTETAKIIAGVVKRNTFHGGEIFFDGEPSRFLVPRPAVARGIAYITEDRKVEGIFETKTIGGNIYTGALGKGAAPGIVVRASQVRELAAAWIDKLKIKAINADARVVELSGGNQQKVVIAKSLVQRPKLVIFDEPTRGVDVGAISDIHATIGELADAGIAVVVISSYLPEILNVSDRILVAQKGRIVEEFSAGHATEEKIMYAAVH